MKPKPIFACCGLPRSGTAWLANLFTTDRSICYHDSRFSEQLTVNYKQVGFSGPELVRQYEEIEHLFPETPWLVVLRSSDDAKASFKAKMGAMQESIPAETLEKFWHERCSDIARLCGQPNVETIDYAMLDNEKQMRKAWIHVLPDLEFNLERFLLLRQFNVQQQVPVYAL